MLAACSQPPSYLQRRPGLKIVIAKFMMCLTVAWNGTAEIAMIGTMFQLRKLSIRKCLLCQIVCLLYRDGSKGGRGTGHAPSQRSDPCPERFFIECNWVWKFSDYMLVLCPKMHIWTYDRHIFTVTSPIRDWPQSGDARWWCCCIKMCLPMTLSCRRNLYMLVLLFAVDATTGFWKMDWHWSRAGCWSNSAWHRSHNPQT